MAKQLPEIDTNSDTFYSWITKHNDLIQLANTELVTANNSANGAVTYGTGYVVGTFGANTICATEIRGGNTIANSAMIVSTNATFTSNVITFNNGVNFGSNLIIHESSVSINTTNTMIQPIDTFNRNNHRSAKYLISMRDGANTNHQVTEMLVIHDGTTTYSTEYATISTNTNIASLSTDIVSNNVRLLITPGIANLQIKISKTLIAT